MSGSIIVYGNCQAEAFSLVITRIAGLENFSGVHYVPSYQRASTVNLPGDAELANCAILFEQQDTANKFPHPEKLPATLHRVTFPSLDFNALWPFNCVNKYNRPEPDFSNGRFPYGDAVIAQCIEHDMSKEEILAYFLSGHWETHWPKLDRLYELEKARLAARDAKCDVTMGTHILETFRTARTFWAVNHPTNGLFAELCSRLLAAGFAKAVAGGNDVLAVLASFGSADLLGTVSIPIHPKVAEHFELAWYDYNERYKLFGKKMLTYEEYFEEMIDAALSAKREATALAVSSDRI